MILLYIVWGVSAVLGICAGALIYKEEGKNHKKHFFGPFIGGTLLAGMFLTALSTIVGLHIERNGTYYIEDFEVVREEPLVAFRNGYEIGGSFFLGTGNIEGRENYIYYEQRADGGIVQIQQNVGGARIYEIEDGTPKVQYLECLVSPNWDVRQKKRHLVKIFVPPNSVVRNFEIK